MVGLKCIPENSAIVEKCTEGGLLLVVAGNNVARMVPPLIIEDEHVDEAMAILETAAGELAAD